ncbi:MAG: hypothetical protein Q7T10_08715 [Rhodoferax sp.]|uniref:hypothetical protein n=1 Tax=Rhodoferax sp. TaxID=50421 RepID=UPI0027251B2F|nr:hypothetical protein [Rhodoferax sp.]MDO8448875.1 hypothetical protein [Rhodoferax sp.]
MSDPAFITKLGQGLYLDSDGVLHQGLPPAKAPKYEMPGGPLTDKNTIDKLAKVFKEIGDAIPNKDDAAKFKKFQDAMMKLGGKNSEDLVKVLGVIGKIAGAVGTAFVVLGVAVAAAKMLGLFGDGPDPLETLITARFEALDREIRSLQTQISSRDLRSQRNAMMSARAAVESFVSQRDSGTMVVAAAEARLQNLTNLLQLVSSTEVLNLLDSSTYVGFFDPDEHKKVYPWITRNLFRLPEGAAPEWVRFPPVNAPIFDSRLAVPLGAQAAQTFLSLVVSLFPDYRTTGDFRPQLRNAAQKLTELAASIKNVTLARTMFTAADFSDLVTDFYVVDPLPGLTTPTLKPDYFRVIGAIDLCNQTDAFFTDAWAPAAVPQPGPTRRGSLDFRWMPPAKLARTRDALGVVHDDGTPIRQYRITNAQECADVANDQSAADYASLLISSGYMTLTHLASQLRHATTQPIVSDTVRGDVFVRRTAQAGAEVTVHSKPAFTYPPRPDRDRDIVAQAWRVPHATKAVMLCMTQPLPRTTLIHYRVFLRTLKPRGAASVWNEPDYESVQHTEYRPDPLHPGFDRLYLHTAASAVLGQELLFEGTTTTEKRQVKRTVQTVAHTFDWWIPTQPLRRFNPLDTIDAVVHNRLIDAGVQPAPVPASPGTPIHAGLAIERHFDQVVAEKPPIIIGLEDAKDAPPWTGFHREADQRPVLMEVDATWQDGHLRVVIDNRPEDRNYVAWLVVEEKFGSVESDEQAPKVLHTAFKVPITGQLTYVPQSLFDEEGKIHVERELFFNEFATFLTPEPGEKIFDEIDPVELGTSAGIERFLVLAKQRQPEVLIDFASRYFGKKIPGG